MAARGFVAIVVLATLSGGAAASSTDELVMPFSCRLNGDKIQLTPSAPQPYAVLGRRLEMPFADCGSRARPGDCATLMIHRFDMSCGAAKVSWADVAKAAANLQLADVPRGLPAGFAPVSALKGRLVLPALARFSAHQPSVERDVLSAESVLDRGEDYASASRVRTPGEWKTVVSAEATAAPQVGAAQLAIALGSLLAMLAAAGWTFSAYAGRGRSAPSWRFNDLTGRAQAMIDVLRSFVSGNPRAPSGGDRTALLNALSIATARLAETELTLASLPRSLLLREVLQGELDQVRGRLERIARDAERGAPKNAGPNVRGALRELERIARIAHGAAQDNGGYADDRASQTVSHGRMPGSIREAYELLGINDDAAPTVAKKLVDALRMSWHPDFARDEHDRQIREARMKQINAAWDMIKNRSQQAA